MKHATSSFLLFYIVCVLISTELMASPVGTSDKVEDFKSTNSATSKSSQQSDQYTSDGPTEIDFSNDTDETMPIAESLTIGSRPDKVEGSTRRAKDDISTDITESDSDTNAERTATASMTPDDETVETETAEQEQLDVKGESDQPENNSSENETGETMPIAESLTTGSSPSTFAQNCSKESLAIRDVSVAATGPTWIQVQFLKPSCDDVSYNISIDRDNRNFMMDKKGKKSCWEQEGSMIKLNVSSGGACAVIKLMPCQSYRINIAAVSNGVSGEVASVSNATQMIHATWSMEQIANQVNKCEISSWNLKWNPMEFDWTGFDISWLMSTSDGFGNETSFNMSRNCDNIIVEQARDGIWWRCKNDNQTREIKLPPCQSYSVALIPVFKNQVEECPKMWKEIVLAPGQVKKFASQTIGKSINFTWEAPENAQCLRSYEVQVNSEPFPVETKENHYPFNSGRSCTEYQLVVTSIGLDGSRSQPVTFHHRTKDAALPRIESMSVEDDQGNCKKLTWKFNPANFIDFQCIQGATLISTQKGRQKSTESIMDGHNGLKTSKINCELVPGNYDFQLELVHHNGRKEDYTMKDFYVSYPLASVTSALIAIMALLIIVVILVGIYVCKPSLYRRLAETVCPMDESKNSGVIMMQRLPKRRSHPIRVRDVPSITRRLCSDANRELENEFDDLKLLSESRLASRNDANKAENKLKNRYVNILPYDHNRVLLSTLPDDPDSDYINASYVMGFNGPKEYIASQGPKECTLADWWRMIWEQNSRVIVMVTALEERGKAKCALYWPDSYEGNEVTYGNIRVKLTEEVVLDIYTLRTFQLTLDEDSRTVKQFYFNNWPDFGCPENPEMLIGFIEAVRCEMVKWPGTGPLVVHCSAGVGRTGTFIAVDWLMQEARRAKEVDVFTIVLRMRECRINMVQTEDQYEFVYQCLSRYVTSRFQEENGANCVVENEALLKDLSGIN